MGMLALFLLGLLGVGMALGGNEKPDPKMPADVQFAFNNLMANASPDMLEAAAKSYDIGGYHHAAEQLRARAAFLRAQQGSPGGQGGFGPSMPPMPSVPGQGLPGTPGGPGMGAGPAGPQGPVGPGGLGGDPPLPPDIQSMVNTMLSDPHGDPAKLEIAATGLDVAGFHATAAAMRARAALLRNTPGTPLPGPAAPPGLPSVPSAAVYVIKPGDSASAIAKRFTGDSSRWKELLQSNPKLTAKTVPVGDPPVNTTLVTPFNPGQVLNLPASWPPVPMA